METHLRQTSLHQRALRGLIDGVFLCSELQREFVWNAEEIVLGSIFKNLPMETLF